MFCNKCHKEKLDTDFYKGSGKECKSCEKVAKQKSHSLSRQRAIEKAANWNKENPDKHRKYCLNHYYKLQDEAILAYGGYKCVCCGTTIRVFLTIDHIANDGNVHRQQTKFNYGASFYRWLKQNNYPPGFQILCLNCNYGKHRNHGICPHQET